MSAVEKALTDALATNQRYLELNGIAGLEAQLAEARDNLARLQAEREELQAALRELQMSAGSDSAGSEQAGGTD